MKAHLVTRDIQAELMNKTELAWAMELRAREIAGEIQAWGFEVFKLRLARNTFYTPDFIVVTAEGRMEAHEVKGFWRDDARVKIKVAAEAFPYIRFLAIQRGKRGQPTWKIEEIR